MKRSAIGLDIGGAMVCAAQLELRAGAKAELVAASCFERAAPGTPVSTREVRRSVDALRRQGFEGEQIVVAMPLAQQLATVCELPPRSSGAPVDVLAREELARAHRCEPAGLQVATWELSAGGGRGRGATAGEPVQCLAVGCATSDVEGWIGSVQDAGADVVALDLRSMALTRGAGVASRGAALVVDVHAEHAHLVAVVAGRVVYERVLTEHGASGLRTKLAQLMKLSPAHVERWMNTHGLRGADDREHHPRVHELRAAVAEWADQLAVEAAASITYAAQRVMAGADVVNAAPVILCGPGSRIAGLAEHMAARGSAGVRLAVPSSVVTVSAECEEWGGDPALPAAIGLAMHPAGLPARGSAAQREEAHA